MPISARRRLRLLPLEAAIWALGCSPQVEASPEPVPEAFVLSETVGLAMEYAVLARDRRVYDRMLDYVKAMRSESGLISWRAAPDMKSVTAASASIDDLTIAAAMSSGAVIWEDRAEKLLAASRDLSDAVLEHEVTAEGFLVDGASWDGHPIVASEKIVLPYLDLATIRALGQTEPRWNRVYEVSLDLLKGAESPQGLFPEILTLTEDGPVLAGDPAQIVVGIHVLYSAIHLAEVGEGGQRTLKFFEDRLRSDGRLEGRYRLTDGQPVAGFESIAVYALAARLAHTLGRPRLAKDLALRMEQYWHMGSFLDNLQGPLDPVRASVFDTLHAQITYQVLLGRPQ